MTTKIEEKLTEAENALGEVKMEIAELLKGTLGTIALTNSVTAALKTWYLHGSDGNAEALRKELRTFFANIG